MMIFWEIMPLSLYFLMDLRFFNLVLLVLYKGFTFQNEIPIASMYVLVSNFILLIEGSFVWLMSSLGDLLRSFWWPNI